MKNMQTRVGMNGGFCLEAQLLMKANFFSMIPQLPIKKRNILRNYDLMYMYPGWAGVDGGTYRKSKKIEVM